MNYKCPKCHMWNGIKKETMYLIKCTNCDYTGNFIEFEAKKYILYIQSTIRVIAFDEKDAKKELESFMDNLPFFDKLIKIEFKED